MQVDAKSTLYCTEVMLSEPWYIPYEARQLYVLWSPRDLQVQLDCLQRENSEIGAIKDVKLHLRQQETLPTPKFQ